MIESSADGPARSFTLFVAGRTVRSEQAESGLRALCEAHLAGHEFAIRVVDVVEDPDSALEASIIATPTVIRHSPPPEVRFLGDLTDVPNPHEVLGPDPFASRGSDRA